MSIITPAATPGDSGANRAPRHHRRHQRDVFRSFLVEGATLAGPMDIPVMESVHAEPEGFVPFSVVASGKNRDYNLFVDFYEDDYEIERFWNDPHKYLEVLRLPCRPKGVECVPQPSLGQLASAQRHSLRAQRALRAATPLDVGRNAAPQHHFHWGSRLRKEARRPRAFRRSSSLCGRCAEARAHPLVRLEQVRRCQLCGIPGHSHPILPGTLSPARVARHAPYASYAPALASCAGCVISFASCAGCVIYFVKQASRGAITKETT